MYNLPSSLRTKENRVWDVKTRLSGLEELLAVIYGSDTRLSTLLRELGFEESQIAQLQNGHVESVVTQFLEVIHKRLTSDSARIRIIKS